MPKFGKFPLWGYGIIAVVVIGIVLVGLWAGGIFTRKSNSGSGPSGPRFGPGGIQRHAVGPHGNCDLSLLDAPTTNAVIQSVSKLGGGSNYIVKITGSPLAIYENPPTTQYSYEIKFFATVQNSPVLLLDTTQYVQSPYQGIHDSFTVPIPSSAFSDPSKTASVYAQITPSFVYCNDTKAGPMTQTAPVQVLQGQ